MKNTLDSPSSMTTSCFGLKFHAHPVSRALGIFMDRPASIPKL